MELVKEISLDIYEQPTYQYVNAKQFDNISRILKITLTDGETVLQPKSAEESAVCRALKPDGTGVIDPATVEADGKITVALTDQMLACAGKVTVDIALVSLANPSMIISTATFFIQVEGAPTSGKQITSTDEFLALVEATAAANKAAAAANDAAGKANTATGKADTATGRANTAAQLLEGMTVTATDVAPGGKATATLTKQGDHYNLDLGLVKGDTGPVSSVNGQTGDVQVMPAPVKFTVSLPASGWVNNAQTVRHAALLADDKYELLVNCAGEYIYADNVTVAGQMTFHADLAPTEDLTIEIIRLEVGT